MASPFTADIIKLPLLGAKQEPGDSPPTRSAPAVFPLKDYPEHPRFVRPDPRPDCGELLRQSIIEREARRTWRDELADDWCEFVDEVRWSPYTHGLCALGGLIAGLLLIIVPAVVIGAAS